MAAAGHARPSGRSHLWEDLGRLGASDWYFERLVDLLDEVFYVVEPVNRRVLYTSPAFERIWGLPLSALREDPLSFMGLIEPEDQPRVAQGLQRQAQGKPNQVEYRIRRADGSLRWIWDRSFSIDGPPGQPARVVGLAADVTEYRLAQDTVRHLQRMEALGHLSGGLAHDVNNVLSVILGNLERLSDMQVHGAEARACIDEALDAVRRGREITDSLLGFARQQPLRVERFDLNPELQKLLPLLRRTAGDRVRLELLPSPEPVSLDADAGSLGSALINLVANARDAMPDGGRIELRVRLTQEADAEMPLPTELAPGKYVMVCVQDEGVGMPPEVLGRVLEPLFTTKPPHLGTGLGLPMAYGLMRRHGGTLRLESAPGRGTRVCLYLPLPGDASTPCESGPPTLPQKGREASGRGLPASSAASTGAGGRPKALVVEDDPALSRLIQIVLQEAGFDVAAVADAGAARSALQAAPFQILVTDLGIPGDMDGLTLARWAVAHLPGLVVILASGSASLEAEADAGWSVLRKPFGPRELLEIMERALGARMPRRLDSGSGRPDAA